MRLPVTSRSEASRPASAWPPRLPLPTDTAAVRRLGIRAQLVVFSVLLVVLAAGGAALAGWRIVEGLIQQATSERLNSASSTFQLLFQQRVSDADIVTRQLSERTLLAQQIVRKATAQITELISPIQTLRPYYSIVVADRDGDVLAKLIPPGRVDPGPNLLDVPGAQEALDLVAAFAVLVRRQDCQMAVAVSVPVKSGAGAVVGLMHLRFPLDDEFLGQIKSVTGIESTLYCGDMLVVSTLPGQASALGTRADPAVAQHVLEDGEEWEENVRLPGQVFRARYVPLLDGEGKPAGMYAVAIPVQTLRTARNEILRYFLPVMAAIAAAAMIIGYLGAAVLTRPLRRLATAAARIGAGDLESPVQSEAEGEDEVALLAAQMEQMRRSLHETYTQLRQLNQLKEEYLFSVAHEVRTPLTSLIASVEVLADDFRRMAPAELEATVRRIERAAVRMRTLLENVLDAGSIRAGRFTIYPSDMDLAAVVESTLTSTQPLLDEKNQRLEVALPRDLPEVLGDERRISQVLANLLTNAAKYGPEGDLIRVNATAEDDHVLVRIADHGPGIPLPEQGELFERYFRSTSTAQSTPGTGLGLAISKAIVEAHGGVMGLESEPEQGTVVWFTLPVARQAPRPLERTGQRAMAA